MREGGVDLKQVLEDSEVYFESIDENECKLEIEYNYSTLEEVKSNGGDPIYLIITESFGNNDRAGASLSIEQAEAVIETLRFMIDKIKSE
jgi:hypothetical protein